MKVGNR